MIALGGMGGIGLVAVAQYFWRVVAAGIIGTSIVIAAAVLGGILAACL